MFQKSGYRCLFRTVGTLARYRSSAFVVDVTLEGKDRKHGSTNTQRENLIGVLGGNFFVFILLHAFPTCTG